jgi:hypothetical protein
MSYELKRNVRTWIASCGSVELTLEPEVLVWNSTGANLAGIIHTWREDDKVTRQLDAFRRVRSFYYLADSL